MTRAAAPSRRARWIGAALFWAVQLGLLFGFGMPLIDTVLVAVLAVGVPGLALAQIGLIDEVEIERLPAYWGSIVTLWFLGSAAWLVGTRDDGAAAVGLVAIPPVALAAWSLGLAAGAFAIILVFRRLAIRLGAPDTPLLRKLMPRTPRERGVFAILSVAAGACEELAYRGYFLGVVGAVFGVPVAVVASSVAFGMVHAYQGALGIARTGLVGAMLAWGYLASGSLWPAIVAHTAIDVLAGIVLGERLLSPRGTAGVDSGPPPREPRPMDDTSSWK